MISPLKAELINCDGAKTGLRLHGIIDRIVK